MTRSYQLRKRAERQEETRQRIVDAAVELHGELGPARTTVSAIAERAGVERHTYYRHFPEERALFHACSGRFNDLNPMPDPAGWRAIADPEERLRHALGELYGYYARHETLLANTSRDAAVHALTAEAVSLHLVPHMAAMRDALADGLAAGRQRRRVLAAIDLALAFPAWQSLVNNSGLRKGDAAKLMTQMVACAARAE